MPALQRLRPDHAASVLAFERANRAWFARSISDRGDAYFDEFNEGFDALLADQRGGGGAYHLLVGPEGEVLGRFNLVFVAQGVAQVGYRMAEKAAGRGLATEALRQLCRIAAAEHGVQRLRAATSLANVASQRVLTKAGFTRVGPADPADVGGKPGHLYELVTAGP